MRRPEIMIFHPTSGWGGAERTSCNITRSLISGSVSVSLLTNEERFIEHLNRDVRLYLVSFKPWFGDWLNILNDLLNLSTIIKHLKPHVIIAMMPYAAFLTSVAKRLSPHPFIYVASPRGSCSSYLRHFVRSRKDKIRYKIFF